MKSIRCGKISEPISKMHLGSNRRISAQPPSRNSSYFQYESSLRQRLRNEILLISPTKPFLRWVLVGIVAIFSLPAAASAISVFDIEYPIAELENCADRTACKKYCDDEGHHDACIAFGKKFGLVDRRADEHVRALEKEGPGGCRGEKECQRYCDDADHINECIDYAEKNSIMTKEEARSARKLGKPGPGGCRGKECQEYCTDSAHQDECLEFSRKEGHISQKEYELIKKVQSKGGPGGCRDQRQCRQYCEDENHTDECLSFAEDQGLIGKEEAIRARKLGIARGPGGCKGQEACHTYCAEPAHIDECVSFAEEHGFMSREEAARARKFANQTGPGGCRGEQCRQYCEAPERAEECLAYAQEHGLIPKQELDRARKFLKASQEGGPGGCKGIECRTFCADQKNQDVCFEFAKKNGLIDAKEEKQFEHGRRILEQVKRAGGPGGCKSDEECRVYCSEPAHVEECAAYAVTHAGVSPEEARAMLKRFTEERFGEHEEFGETPEIEDFRKNTEDRFEQFRKLESQFRGRQFFEPGEENRRHDGDGFPSFGGGPGGCSSPAECIRYCIDHLDECRSFTNHSPEKGMQERMRPPENHNPQNGFPEGFNRMPFQGFPERQPGFQGSSSFPGGPGNDGFGQCVAESVRALPHDTNVSPEEIFKARQQAVQACAEKFGRRDLERFGDTSNQSVPPTGQQPHEFFQQEGFGRPPFEGIGPAPGTNGIFTPLQKPPEPTILQPLAPIEQKQTEPAPAPSSRTPVRNFLGAIAEFLFL